MEKFNGWTNRDTWCMNLWLTNYNEAIYERSTTLCKLKPTGELTKAFLIREIENLNNPDHINYDNVVWTELIESLAS